MAPRNKEQKTAAAGSINDLKEGDFLDPDLGLDPDLTASAGPAAGVDPAAGDGPAAGSDTAGYIAVVVTGATLKFNGEQYAHSQTVKLPLKTAKRLMAIGLVKPLSVVRQELEAKARVGLSITADAGGVEFITGG